MVYRLPPAKKSKRKSVLEPYFEWTRHTLSPGAHRLQLLLTKWLDLGILNLPTLLITGSNGKGTTCAFIESILRNHGLKTGLYTSPHLIHPHERVKINGLAVSEKCLKKSLDVIVQESKKYLPHASFFELITATALLIFFKKKVDVLVCEVGLGGHFDSTNALCPFVSVLTNISLEHTDFLGHSLQDIAADKAYISRKNKPFIVGKVSNQAVQGIVETTNIIGAELIFADDIENKDQEFLLLNLKMGSFAYLNAENLKLALCAVFHFFLENSQKNFPLDPQKIKQAIESTYWPGRFDVRTINGRSVIFDAAHNFDGFLFFLAQYQKSLFRSQKCILVFASLKDKNWKKTLTLFPRIACSVIFTQIDSKRAEDARSFENYIYQNESTDLFSSYKGVNIATFLKLDDALEAAMNQSPPHPLLMIGSIAFIGKAMSRFGLSIVRGLE